MGSYTSERRQSLRWKTQCEVCLTASMKIVNAKVSDNEESSHLTFFGSTNDISTEGLAFILPSVHIDERYCVEGGQTIQIVLYLPTTTVEMQAAPVRCQPLNEREPERGYLIGARITGMGDNERAQLLTYLRTVG